MPGITKPRLRVFVNFLHNINIYRNHIIILIGNNKILLSAVKRTKLLDSKFISAQDQDYVQQCILFLHRFKNYRIFFLLDSSECAVHHELVPVMQSLIKLNPVEAFMEEHFSMHDIIGYTIHSISDRSSETWNTTLAVAQYQPPLSTLLGSVLENAQKFEGIYFLALELTNIINFILISNNNAKCSEHLQIFVFVLEVSAIQVVVKHVDNVMSIKTVDYPYDKSLAYIQGVIEQEISDCLIYYKSYVTEHSLKICIICLVNNELQKLMQQSNFEGHETLLITIQSLLPQPANNDPIFADQLVTQCFVMKKSFLGLNSVISDITKLTLFNNFIFKPLIIVIIILLLSIINIKVNTVLNARQIANLNTEYYTVAQKYRHLKQEYNHMYNIANLTDLYTADALLQVSNVSPFDILVAILDQLSDPRIYIEKIRWNLQEADSILVARQFMNIEIDVRFSSNNATAQQAIRGLDEYMRYLSKRFNDFKVHYNKFTRDIIEIYDNVVIPVSISILGPYG